MGIGGTSENRLALDNRFPRRTALDLAEAFDDPFNCTVECPPTGIRHFPGPLTHGEAFPRRIEQAGDGGFEFIHGGNLNERIVLQKVGKNGPERFHPGSGQDRLPENGGLDGILSAAFDEAFPDKNDVGFAVKTAQFTDGVDDQAMG